jgi:hypothetical protein
MQPARFAIPDNESGCKTVKAEEFGITRRGKGSEVSEPFEFESAVNDQGKSI